MNELIPQGEQVTRIEVNEILDAPIRWCDFITVSICPPCEHYANQSHAPVVDITQVELNFTSQSMWDVKSPEQILDSLEQMLANDERRIHGVDVGVSKVACAHEHVYVQPRKIAQWKAERNGRGGRS